MFDFALNSKDKSKQNSESVSSVTRFGEILPLWPNFKSICPIFEGSLLTFAKILNLPGQILIFAN